MRARTLLLGAAASCVMFPSTTILAQTSSGGSEEIIVTARKRQESILKVPVTATVLSSAMIQRANIINLFDVSKKTVGLKLGIGSVETGALISIRGFGTNATDPGVDQSVSLNLDGLQITQGFAYLIGTFDMAQIEVLKGPQALFFGKASPAGVVSIRTADPGDHFEAIGRVGYEGVAKESRAELILSGPLTETLGVRVAAAFDHFGGYFKNNAVADLASGALPLGKRLGENRSVMIRGTVVYKPAPNFSARLKMTYSHDREHDSTVSQNTNCPNGLTNIAAAAGLGFVANQLSPKETCKLDRYGAIVGMNPAAFPGMENNPNGIHALDGGKPAAITTQKFASLELKYSPSSSIDVTSVTGFYRIDTNSDYNCYNSGGGAPSCMTEKRLNRRDYTQELRVGSDYKGPFNFTLGAFYQDGRIHDDETLPGNTRYFLPPLVFAGNMTIKIKSYSFFGQGRYKITDQFELAGGVRWSNEKRRFAAVTYDEPFTAFHTGQALGTPIYLSNPGLNSKNYSPEITLTYTPTDDLTFYGSWKQAYKSGSYNIITATQPAGPVSLVNGRYVGVGEPRSYGDEKIQGFEVGIKSRWLDRQLNFNMAGYYYKASDLQVGTQQPAVNGLPILQTLNAARAKIYGIEADFNYKPDAVPGLELFGAVNYNHSRFTSYPNSPCVSGDLYSEGCNRQPAPSDALGAFSAPNNLPPGVTAASLPVALQGGAPFRYTASDVSGTPLVRAPDWTATAGIHYQMPIGGEKKIGLGSDVQYSSKYSTLVGLLKSRPYFYQKAYAKLNATVTLGQEDDSWELAFIGNNLTGKHTINTQNVGSVSGALFFVPAIVGGTSRGPVGLGESISVVDRGRELWVRLTVKFGS